MTKLPADTWFLLDRQRPDPQETVDLWIVPLMPNSTFALGLRLADCHYRKTTSKEIPFVGWVQMDPINGKWRSAEFKAQDGTQWKAVAWRFRPAVPQAA